MIRMQVFKVNADWSCNRESPLRNKQIAPIESLIAQIGYDNIKNIIVSAPDSIYSYYTIFYEDGQPYTPYVEDEPKKKGIFG